MSHYDVLGIAPEAPPDAIRSAYVARARQHHPDRHAGADPDTRAEAQRTMQRINEAWLVLRDATRRAEYDRSLRRTEHAAATPNGAPAEPRWRPGMVHPDFVPYDDGSDDVAVDDDLFDDTPYGTRPVPRSHQLLPVATLAASLACLCVGLAVNLIPLMALGGFLLAAAALGFILTPMLAVMRSARERR